MQKPQPTIAGFADGQREPTARECGQPLEAGKGKKTDCALELPERNVALLIPFSPGRPSLHI